MPFTDAPARLKKELDAVLTLQADIDTSEHTIQSTRIALQKSHASSDSLEVLASLQCSHARLLNKVDILYASLNVHDKFPELKGVNLEFVQILLMARDLKINIRKRAIGSFFEWDKLDRAIGGKEKMLGTFRCKTTPHRTHQLTLLQAPNFINRHVRPSPSVSQR